MPPRPRKLVVAAVIAQDDKVLLSQRREDQVHPLKWELPGGKIEPGESPEVALRRELSEELGVDARVGAIWDVLFHAYDTFDVYLLVYRCQLAPALEPRAVEVAAVAWVDRTELVRWDVLPADAPLMRRLAGPDCA